MSGERPRAEGRSGEASDEEEKEAMSVRPLVFLVLVGCRTGSDAPNPAPKAEPTAKSDWQITATAQREVVDAGPGESAEAIARAPEAVTSSSAKRADAGPPKR